MDFQNSIYTDLSDKYSQIYNRLDGNLEIINNNLDKLNAEVTTVVNTISDLSVMEPNDSWQSNHVRPFCYQLINPLRIRESQMLQHSLFQVQSDSCLIIFPVATMLQLF